jgi:hypothetical protein
MSESSDSKTRSPLSSNLRKHVDWSHDSDDLSSTVPDMQTPSKILVG